MYSYSDRDTRTKTATQYLFPDSTSFFNEGSRSRDKGHNLRADFRMQWKIDGNNTLDFRPRFSFSSRRSESMDTSFLRAGDALRSLVNSQESQRANKGTSFQANGELIFNHNFPSRPGRSFSVQLNYSFSNTRQYSTSLSELVYCLSKDDDEDLYRFMDSKQWNNTFGGRLIWTEPLGDVSKGNYKANNADKLTYDLASDEFGLLPQFPTKAPEGAEADPNLSNRFRNSFFSQEMQVGYKKVGKDFNLEAGMVFAPSQSSPVCAGGSQRPAAFRQTTVRVPRRHP